jgi:anti-sigma B factor antagonist
VSTPPPESMLRVREEDGVLIVTILGRDILDESAIGRIGEEVGRLIDTRPRPRVVLSFSEVEHLSSPTLGVLITLYNKIRGKNGQFRLADMTPKIHQIFTVTQLDTILAIHGTTEDAVASMD